MPHACEALLIHCIDFRLGGAVRDYLKRKGLLNNCDIVSLAGAAKNLVPSAAEAERSFVLKQIDIAKRLHGIRQVVLMNHTDCGAYGGKAAFGSEAAEREGHIEDMRKAKTLIAEVHPELETKIVLAHINPEGVQFEEIE